MSPKPTNQGRVLCRGLLLRSLLRVRTENSAPGSVPKKQVAFRESAHTTTTRRPRDAQKPDNDYVHDTPFSAR